jgi:hypothetical protein
MNFKEYKEYKKTRPYHIWVYRDDGSKFVGHFKNRRGALSWAKATKTKKSRLGKVTTASKSRLKHQNKTYNLFYGNKLPNYYGRW